MGNCGSTEEIGEKRHGDGESSEIQRRSRALDKELRDHERRLASQVKILLLGAGESGKTTILKQMKVIHEIGFTDEETEGYRRQVFMNLWEAMRLCLEGMQELDLKLADPANREYLHLFEESPMLSEGQEFPLEYKVPMQCLWRDENVQQVVTKTHEIILPDSLFYFYNDLGRFFVPGYRPSLDDIFRVRGKTTGITETVFIHQSMTYRMFDVGGQRSERRKWIHCFENVTAVLFLVALSGYDQSLIEDRDSNQMREALMLFDSICNSSWFTKSSMILFLNKVDIFVEKLLRNPLSNYWPEYAGANEDTNAAKDFFKKIFLATSRNKQKEVYCAYTTAIDTNLLRVVMVTIQDTILQRNLASITF